MMRQAALSILVTLTLTGMAGCLDQGVDVPNAGDDVVTPPTRDEIYARVNALLADVPCEAPFDATKTTDNLKLLANFTLTAGDKTFGGRELDTRGDKMLTTMGGYGGIGLFDASDPLNPVVLSTVPTKGEYDVKFVTDDTAVVGVGAGIAIVDLRNPANITQSGLWKWEEAPQPPRGGPSQNAHMLASARIADKDWVFLAPNSNTGVWVFEMTGEPGAKKLTFITQTLPVEGGPLGPHDMTVQYDEDLKTWVLYSADGFHGWAVFDIKDPTKPALIGGLARPESGYTHTIQAAKVGSRRLVATIQEVGLNQLEIYDATNLRAPILLGTWQHSAAAIEPQHNINIAAGRLYMAHYGNGVFVFDLSKVGMLPLVSEVKPVAHYGGAHEIANPGDLGFQQFYDVVVKDGVVYAASYGGASKGIHVIGDGCLVAGDATQRSIG